MFFLHRHFSLLFEIVGNKLITAELQHELVQLTKELIRIPSTATAPEQINRCADYIEKWLTNNGIVSQRYTCNNVPSLLVLPTKSTATKVLLMAHFDVVETGNETLFSPRVENGCLYGRGSIDDKYAVALSLLLFREHLAKLKMQGLSQKDICFGLLFTGDEEVGGTDGVGSLCEQLDPEFCVTLDGGNPGLIVTKEKGILRLQLEATGCSAHAARPWLGENAFDILMQDYTAVQSLFTEENPGHWNKTVTLTKCVAGNGSVNMVPGTAQAVLDVRYTESDEPDELIAAIKDITISRVSILAKAPVFYGGESVYCDLLLTHAKGAVLGFEHGASDARYFSERNIPGVVWGAVGEMSQHTENEHIVIESMYLLFDQLDEFLKEIAEV